MGTSLPRAHLPSSLAQVQHCAQPVLHFPMEVLCLEPSAGALEPECPLRSAPNAMCLALG